MSDGAANGQAGSSNDKQPGGVLAGGSPARGRPVGAIAQALALAAQVRPGTVRDLAQRAQVGYAAARYTASRMLARGDLVRVERLPPTQRGQPPSVYGPPAWPDSGPDAGAAGLVPAGLVPLTRRGRTTAATVAPSNEDGSADAGAAELQKLLAGWMTLPRR